MRRSSPPPPFRRTAQRGYAAILRFFPRDYRHRHGDELETFFGDAYAEAWRAGALVGVARCCARAGWDVVRHGLTERWSTRHRATGGQHMFPDVMQDIVYGLRSIRRAPGYAAITVVTMGLGVGANAAMFSVVRGVMLRPLPYAEPERLVTVWEANLAHGMERMQASYPNYREWREQQRSFADLAAFAETSVLLRGEAGREAVRVGAARVAASFFDVLRAAPVMGRGFVDSDDEVGAAPVAVLSYGLWQRQFGGAPNVVGRSLDFVGGQATVIGVMPPAFAFPNADVEFWVPIDPERQGWPIRAAHFVTVIGRLAPGVGVEQANLDLALIAENVQAAFPGEDPAHSALVLPLGEVAVENVRAALWVLFGAVGLVLLIACVNIANLTLARATARGREIAVRRALGANRGRITRQLVIEGLVLAAIAGAGGLAFSVWVVETVVANLPGSIPRGETIRVDGVVVLFALITTITTGLLFTVVPAFTASGSTPALALRTGRGSAAGGAVRVRQGLVVAEVALSCVLVVGAGLLINSFWRMLQVDPGFETDRMVTMTVTLSGSSFDTPDRVIDFYRDLPARLESLPQVRSVGAVNALPVSGGDSRGSITIEGRPFAEGTAPAAAYRRVLPNYFAAMGIPLLAGRPFDERDTGDDGFVTIIDQAMAERFWPDDTPIGKRIKIGPPDNEPWLTIVGVVGNVRNRGLDDLGGYDTYEPHPQRPWTTMHVVVRTEGDPTMVAPAVRRALFDIDPTIVVYGTNTMQRRVQASFAVRRFQMILVTSFAGVALFLALVGIYGVMSYTVAQRENELGIRMALGATVGRVRAGVVRDGLVLAAIGVAAGAALSTVATRSMRSLLFDVRAVDPVTIAAVSIVVVLVAVLASLGPAHRATTVDPLKSLGKE